MASLLSRLRRVAARRDRHHIAWKEAVQEVGDLVVEAKDNHKSAVVAEAAGLDPQYVRNLWSKRNGS